MKRTKKILLALAGTVFLANTAFAAFEVVAGKTLELFSHNYDEISFKEGKSKKEKIKFAVAKLRDRLECAVVMSDGNDKPLWLSTMPYSIARNASRYQAYGITQYRDTETGRYFYTVQEAAHQDGFFRSHLLGYNADKTKLQEFLDSNSLKTAEFPEPRMFNVGNNLYLVFSNGEFGPSNRVTYYRLIWSDESQWFGYEYLPNGYLPEDVALRNKQDNSKK